eukprot:11755638-Alexandrium_andersonii.AAC.1
MATSPHQRGAIGTLRPPDRRCQAAPEAPVAGSCGAVAPAKVGRENKGPQLRDSSALSAGSALQALQARF